MRSFVSVSRGAIAIASLATVPFAVFLVRPASSTPEPGKDVPERHVLVRQGSRWVAPDWQDCVLGTDLRRETEWPVQVRVRVTGWMRESALELQLIGTSEGLHGDFVKLPGGRYLAAGEVVFRGVRPLEPGEIPRLRIRPTGREIALPPVGERVALVEVEQFQEGELLQRDSYAYDQGDGRTRPPERRREERPEEQREDADPIVPASFTAPVETDTVTLVDKAAGDEAGLFVRAHLPGLCLEQTFYAVDSVAVGNLSNGGGCGAELAVFSVDNALYYEKAFPWSDSTEEHLVSLKPSHVLPLMVWVVHGDFDEEQKRVEQNVLRANELFSNLRFGIHVELKDVVDCTELSAAYGLEEALCELVFKDLWFDGTALNAYYSGNVSERGVWCHNMIFIGETADNETLLHELGHALGLLHTNNVDDDGDGVTDLPKTNIMNGGGSDRDSMTAGQAFRSNLYHGSVINTKGTRNGEKTLDCKGASCLPLGYDL